jgi:parvulin-like peptidyl-prolyl isomerase
MSVSSKAEARQAGRGQQPPPLSNRGKAAATRGQAAAVQNGKPDAIAKVAQRRRIGLLPACIVLAALVAGASIGAAVMKQRYKAKGTALAVNGVTISEEEIFHRLQMIAGSRTLGLLINEQLVMQYARDHRLAPSESAITAEAAKSPFKPGLRHFLGLGDQNPTDLKRQLRFGMSHIAMRTDGITVSDDEIKRFYQENADPKNPYARFITPESATVGIIATRTEAEGRSALLDVDRGVKFETVAKTRSIHVTRINGGIVSDVMRGRSELVRVPGLDAAIFSTKVGQKMGPRKFGDNWWVVWCIDRKSGSITPFEEAKEECVLGAKLAKADVAGKGRTEAVALQGYLQKAKIDVLWPQYATAVRELQESVR